MPHNQNHQGHWRYFLGIEVAQSKNGLVISQRTYALNILEETGMINAKSIDTNGPMIQTCT